MGGYYNPYASGFSAAHMAAAAAAAAAQQSGQVGTNNPFIPARRATSTLQRNSNFCITRKGTERPQSQFPQSCVCERFRYSHDRSTYSPAAEQADRSWDYINHSQIHEFRNLVRSIHHVGLKKSHDSLVPEGRVK